MPFVWTAINVMTILNNNQQGVNEIGTMANINNSNASSNNSGGSNTGNSGLAEPTTTASSKASSLDRRGTAAGVQMMAQNCGGVKGGNSNSNSSIGLSSAYGLKKCLRKFQKSSSFFFFFI